MGNRVFDIAACVSGIAPGTYYASRDDNGKDFTFYSNISTSGSKQKLSLINGTEFSGVRITGSWTSSGRYFTFKKIGAKAFSPDLRVSFHYEILRMKLNQHLGTSAHTRLNDFISARPAKDNPIPRTEVEVNCGAPSNKTTFEFYVIAKLVNGVPVFSSGPKVHKSYDSAATEAARLAKLENGNKFVVFQATSAVSVGALVWEDAK